MKKCYQRYGLRHLNQESMDYEPPQIEKCMSLTHLALKSIKKWTLSLTKLHKTDL